MSGHPHKKVRVEEMFMDLGNQAAKLEMRAADQKATFSWRFRKHGTKQVRVLQAVVTAVLSLFGR